MNDIKELIKSAKECLANHGKTAFCEQYDCRSILQVYEWAQTHIQELEKEVKKADELLTEISIYWGVPQPLKEKIIAYQAYKVAVRITAPATKTPEEGEDENNKRR